MQYDTDWEAAKISALSSGKIDNYEYLTGEKILPSDQSRITEQAKFACSPLAKAFKKQTKTIAKTIEEQGQKQVKALEVLKSDLHKEDMKSIEGPFLKDKNKSCWK